MRVVLIPDADESTREDQVLPSDADLLVVRSEALADSEAESPLDLAGEEQGPGVVVLAQDEQMEEEVRLVAAGATAVVDLDQASSNLVDELVTFAEAEAEGGVHGPESGGATAEPKLADFQSRSPRMRDFLDLVRQVASSDSTLMITGETGVGKERLARAIHAESERADNPFVSVNCGALQEHLLESELFGHERGSFTGASGARKGHFELADQGTIFLDEIGEMPLHLQVKLLTVLQRREVQPLGSEQATQVDVRVIAATNRDLASHVQDGSFREDLFFRLNVVSLDIPPLRERREDIPWFVGRFIRHFSAIHGVELSTVESDALRVLVAYAWPGNVRELSNAIERAILICKGSCISLSDLPDTVRNPDAGRLSASDNHAGELLKLPLQEAKRRLVEEFERRYLHHLLQEHSGVLAEVAHTARINPRTLYDKMRRLDLNRNDYR